MKTLVLDHACQPAFPNHAHGWEEKNARYMPSLQHALASKHNSDVHISQYSAPSLARRLDTGMLASTRSELWQRVKSEAESYATRKQITLPSSKWIDVQSELRWNIVEKIRAEGGVLMHCILFDIDGPEDPVTNECTEEFRDRIRQGVANLFRDHGGLCYETRGGARIVYELQTPMRLMTKKDASLWTGMYQTYCQYVSRWTKIPTVLKSKTNLGHGIDLSCKDWPRLFRAPRVIREEGQPRENRPIIGELNAFEPMLHELRFCYVPPPVRIEAERTSDSGIFIEMFRAMNTLGVGKSNFFFCRCPLWFEHTDKTKDGLESSCAVYGASEPGGWGTVECKHSHHIHLRGAGDWIKAAGWTEEEFNLSPTWVRLNSPDTNDSWGEHEDKKEDL